MSSQNFSRYGLLKTLGTFLTLLGGGVLITLGVLCFFIITSPSEITLVQYVLEHVRAGDSAIYGHMTDIASGRKMDFVLNWSESVRTISFLFLGVAILGVLAGIAKILITSGVSILKISAGKET